MTSRVSLLLILFSLIPLWTASFVQADGETPVFAVVSEAPKDKARVSAKVSVNDVVSDMKLLASETILNNLIWKKLEICHAMKMEGHKVAEGFQIVTVHVIDAGMLPMSLQSFAGDCLIKKALAARLPGLQVTMESVAAAVQLVPKRGGGCVKDSRTVSV